MLWPILFLKVLTIEYIAISHCIVQKHTLTSTFFVISCIFVDCIDCNWWKQKCCNSNDFFHNAEILSRNLQNLKSPNIFSFLELMNIMVSSPTYFHLAYNEKWENIWALYSEMKNSEKINTSTYCQSNYIPTNG